MHHDVRHRTYATAVLLLTPIVVFAALMAFAPDAVAQASRVTQELERTNGEVQKWITLVRSLFSAAAIIIACWVGIQWWEERGRGKDSAKGLIMGVAFAFCVAPWMITCAEGCGTGTGAGR